MMTHRLFRVLFMTITLHAGCLTAQGFGAAATLSWDHSSSPDVAGYRIYLGSQSGHYERSVDVGYTTSATIQELSNEMPTYIAATSYDSLGNESAYSEEVVYQPAAPVPDTSAPVWTSTPGICSARDTRAGGTVVIEFGSATDDRDGSHVRYNLYFAPTVSWNDADWNRNMKVSGVIPTSGTTCAYAFTITGLQNDVTYTFGVRVADQSGNEDANTRTATAAPSTKKPSAQFTDDFSTNSVSRYTVTQTRINGGMGRFLYNAPNKRAQLLTGSYVGTQFARKVPAATDGSFRVDFLPTAKHAKGGILWVRLRQDANNYYEMKNTDGYGPGYFRKIVNGQIVDETAFESEFDQNQNYEISIDFCQEITMLQAFGETLTLAAEKTSILVQKFEIELLQQDAYFDNIAYEAYKVSPGSYKVAPGGPPTLQNNGNAGAAVSVASAQANSAPSTNQRSRQALTADSVWTAVTPAILYPLPADPTGSSTPVEIGVLNVDDGGRDLMFADRFRDPVLLTFSLTRWETDPFQVHIQELKEDRAHLRLVEWADFDGWHEEEAVAYLVINSGHYRFEGGFHAEAGNVAVERRSILVRVPFQESFEAPPVVVAQGCGRGRERPESFQIVAVEHDGFMVFMRYSLAEEALDNPPRICYLAVEAGSGTIDGAVFEAGRTPVALDGKVSSVPLQSKALEQPKTFLAALEFFDMGTHRQLMGEVPIERDDGVALRVETEYSSGRKEPKEAVAGYLAVSGQ